jgi:hypothetical protein
MAFIIKLAQLIARLGDAFDEALQARQDARRKHPFVPEE